MIYYIKRREDPITINEIKEIESNKKLKCCNDDKLNDLLNKMLKINIDERISWDEYFNHPFFNDN